MGAQEKAIKAATMQKAISKPIRTKERAAARNRGVIIDHQMAAHWPCAKGLICRLNSHWNLRIYGLHPFCKENFNFLPNG